ncbi:Bone morphogenetic protein receptor type-2, partial [Stegodyphus mimosarum]
MLCDFGFAIRLCGSKYILNGEEQVAEETSLADVGTLRYMAPEILEGAVNLRDCESSLKQTDVYALGLVMWEIASRCSDLFQGVEVPPYKQPFEAEVGLDPTMEQMQSLVAKLKARPLFPDIWKGTNPAIRSLKETIEDCWDQDAEARLTTLCVKERLMELPVLWERYKAGLGIPGGISPTLNSTVDLHESSNLQKKSCTDSDLGLDITDQDQLIIPRERTNSVSECTTETLLSPSDTNLKNILNSNDSSATKVSVSLQPHQGRNPCLARNLLQEQSDDLPVIGNVLHDDNSKYISDKRIYSFSDGDANIFSLPNGMQSSLLASSDRINHSNRVCNPIPYVQNHINFPSIIPKQPNIPANMGSKDLFKKDEKRWGPFRYFGRKTAKDSIRAGLKILLDRKTSMSNGYLPEEQQPLKNSGISSPISPSESNIKQGQINPVNSFWTCNEVRETDHTVNRQVKISKPEGSVPLVRPFNNNPEKVEVQENVLKNDSQLLNGYAVVIDDKENKHDVSPDFTTENKIKPGEREKSKRPTTLPVQSFNDDQDDEELLEISNMDISKESVNGQVVQQENTDNKTVPIRRKGSGNKRKGVKRVKTPFEIKGRFSLYDDRIMSSQELPTGVIDCTSHVMQSQLDNTRFSASVPLNMNTLCLTSQASSSVPSDQTKETEYNKADEERPLNGSVAPVNYHGHQNIISLCDI